jgi:hypothetical protein
MLNQVYNKETGDSFLQLMESQSRFIDGEEYLPVKKSENSKDVLYLKKSSLTFKKGK